MTHSVDAPLPPPGTTGTATTTAVQPRTTDSRPSSTTDVAKDQARDVGETAAQAGSQVASTAADQAKNVVQQTQRQAQDLLQQAQTQLREQATNQQQKAAEGVTSLAQQLRNMADGTGQDVPGPARDLVQQASGKLEDLGRWLQTHEPGDLLDEVRSYARRKPGTFLLGAALAGVVAGRLTTGIKAAHTGSGIVGGSAGGGSQSGPRSTNYVDPTPAYSGYEDSRYRGADAPLPPPPYGTVPPDGSIVPPTTPAGWDDPARRSGGVTDR
jgi:hypothetical protein